MDYAMPINDSPQTPHIADAPDVTEAERIWATFMHLTTIMQHAMIPIVPALVMWLIKRKDSEFINDTGKEVLNFQISLLIYAIISGILMMVLIGFPLFVAVYILGIVGLIKGAIAANKGRYYRYPMCIRFIS